MYLNNKLILVTDPLYSWLKQKLTDLSKINLSTYLRINYNFITFTVKAQHKEITRQKKC